MKRILLLSIAILLLVGCSSTVTGGLVGVYSGGLGYAPFYPGAYVTAESATGKFVVSSDAYIANATKVGHNGFGWRVREELSRYVSDNLQIGIGASLGQQHTDGEVDTFYAPTLLAKYRNITFRLDLPDHGYHKTSALSIDYKVVEDQELLTFEPTLEIVRFENEHSTDIGLKVSVRVGITTGKGIK